MAVFVFLAVSREELVKHVARLQGTLDRERDERNFYQLDRDRMDTFWEVTRRELGETRAEVRGKDRSAGGRTGMQANDWPNITCCLV